MTFEEKIKAVETVFQELDSDIRGFQGQSGFHCLPGCGKCCLKPEIEATTLEFLPFAYFLYRSGLALTWIEKIKNSTDTLCLILSPVSLGSGFCSEYAYRGLICRLFGFSARRNKHGKPELVTCQTIKTNFSETYAETTTAIASGNIQVPLMGSYYMKLHAIDADLTREYLPINIAIQRAIETVLHYFAYRETG